MGAHDGYWMWGLGGLFMLLFWVLVILAIAALVRWLVLGAGAPGDRGRDPGSGASRSAREILEERYARGEIDRDEYLQKKADLEN
jgi:putative membrane protein